MTAPTLMKSRFPIVGMDCADCARTLQRALSETDGVASVDVRFESGTAVVEHDDTIAPDAKLARVIEQAGYKVGGASAPTCALTFDVTGMDCADCARSAQSAVARLPGIATADVSFETGLLRVTGSSDQIETGAVIRAVESAGYKATLRDGMTRPRSEQARWQDRRLQEILLAAGLWLAGMIADHGLDLPYLAIVLYLSAIVLAGFRIARAARVSLTVRRADMNLLMTLAAIGAIILGDFSEASSLVVLFALGIYLQSATLDRTRGAIKRLLDLTPPTARLLRNDQETSVQAITLQPGDVIRVLPGERIPVDGTVLSGHSDLDQAQITGESRLRSVTSEDTVYAGSMNSTGALTITASSAGNDTSLARIVDLVEEAQASKAAIQGTVERFAAIYTPVVIGLAAAIALVGGGLTGHWSEWFYRGLILLVVACPCALIISTPVAYVSAIGRGTRLGVLFKGGIALDGLAAIKTLAFDKTGTLTHGRPEVEAIVTDGLSEVDVLGLAAGLECGSTHPIARGILRAANTTSIAPVEHVQVVPGQGMTGVLKGTQVAVGSRALASSVSARIASALSDAQSAGKTTVLVVRDEVAVGVIVLADSVRPISRQVIADLKHLGIDPVLLSGDSEPVVQSLAASVGIDHFEAGLMPAQKSEIIRTLSAEGPIGMVGDGINDAPALAQATVGIAMGVGGSTAAIDAADVALMGDDLTMIPVAVRLARATQSIVWQNIAFALITKLAFVGLTVGGYTSLWLAVLADVGASLLVTLNAMRLGRLKVER